MNCRFQFLFNGNNSVKIGPELSNCSSSLSDTDTDDDGFSWKTLKWTRGVPADLSDVSDCDEEPVRRKRESGSSTEQQSTKKRRTSIDC